MYVFLYLSIAVICICLVYIIKRQKENFRVGNDETMYRAGLIVRPDWEAMESYCNATNRDISLYRKSVVTDKHLDMVKELQEMYETHKDLQRWPSQVKQWSLAITDGSVEYGYAFTVGSTMYLPVSYLKSNDYNTKVELLFHELRHIWQREDYHRCLSQLDSAVWKGWRWQVVEDPIVAVNQLKRYSKDTKQLVINPDTFQVMAFTSNATHPTYPIRENDTLAYIMRNNSERVVWRDPHPCEWDAREAAQNILNTE